MARVDGSAALKLDFGGVTTTSVGLRRVGLRLATSSVALLGPEKYKMLGYRRREAQIKARHLLELLELMEEAR